MSRPPLRARVICAAVVALATALFPTGTPAGAVAPPSSPKGPVGLDLYRHLDQLPYLSTGVRTRQYSSFDRQGGNSDWSHNLADAPDGKVIAERQGPGEIDAIWDTINSGDPTAVGKLKIELDGQTVVNAPFVDIVNGKLGAPFVYPLVASGTQSSGGVTITVPMPFRSSMRVSTDKDPSYYHVTYRAFADNAGVTTFNPAADKAQDVLGTFQQAGTRDPKPAAPGASTAYGSYELPPGGTATLAQANGSGAVTGIRLRIPQVQHPTAAPLNDDGRAFGSGGASQFAVAVNPGNTGVRLTRRYDPQIGHQVANVSVNGTQAGQWSSPAGIAAGSWADQTVTVPASATAGKSQLTVRNAFVSSDMDINEFRYDIDQQVGGVWSRADTVDIGPDHTATEAAHQYQITGQTWSGTRSFSYPVPGAIADDGRAFGSGGASQFTVAVPAGNTGVRLTRRYDPQIGHQKAEVTVNGTDIGAWQPVAAVPAGSWADESIEIPAAVSAGKTQLTVKNVFVSSDMDINEFSYWADAHVPGGLSRSDTVNVGNATSETAHGYQISAQTWSGSRTFAYPNSDAVLTGARIRISFDGNQTVDAPLGEFFGSPEGSFDVRSLMTSIDTRPGGWYSSWWPMPYGRSVTVQLYNGSGTPISTGESAVTTAPDPQWATALAAGTAGYFHATAHAGATTPGQDWNFLTTTGHGKFVGVAQGFRGQPKLGENFLEGDERVYADGTRSPDLHGTGTEDFYQSGWYFNHGPVTNPLTGEASHEANGGNCAASSDCVGAYRLMLADAVPFGSGLTFGIEHGDVDNVAATYSSTAFWYGQPTATLKPTDTLTVGDPTSESAHSYTSTNPGPVTSLTADYEGNDTGTPANLTQKLRATTAPVTFTLAVDPDNHGVTLRRTSDQNASYQRAQITVDGQAAGQWLEPLGNTYHRWLDDEFILPAALTSGKAKITVTITPVSGAPAWSAARYQALSTVS